MKIFSTKKNKGFTIGELLIVFVVVLILVALMFPLIRYNYQKMERIICANNLKEVSLALYIYAKDHNGRFPPTLKILYDQEYLADKELMDCPATKRIGTPEDPDYLYTAGLSVDDPSLYVLMEDKPGNHPDGGRNVLYVNSEVVWKPAKAD